MAALDPVGQLGQQNTMNSALVQPQYPAMPEVSPNKPLLKSLGATGTAIFSGIITSEEYNPDFYWRDGVKIYEQMLRNDAQVNATREMLELPIRRATWSIQPASDDPRDQEIAAFVRACLFDEMTYTTASGRTLHQKWDDILRHILLHLSFGFMCFEVNWRIEDGFVKWSRWTPLLPRTVWRWWVGADNELAGIQQWTFKDYSYCFVDIPADKLLLFARRQEGNNFEGVSVFRSAYKHWWMKQNFERIDAVGIERNAVVPPVIHLPEGFSESDITQAQQIAQNMRVNEAMGVTLPPGWDLEFPKNQQKYAANTLASIQYHDIMIARNVLAQFINLGSTETGAYSLDKSQVSTFLASLQAVCEYIEDVINGDAIKRLVDYNYDGVKNYPKLKCSKLTAQNIEALAQALAQLANMQQPLLTPDTTLEAWLREQFGIPAASPNPVDTENPGSPTTPERPENQEREDDHSDQESQNVRPPAHRGDKSGSGGAASPTGAGGADGGGEAGAAAAEAQQVREEARLLRETLDAVYAGVDNVERGMVFFNPNHDARGRFAPGSGGGGMGHTGSGGHGPREHHAESHERGGSSRGGTHGGGGSGRSGSGGATRGAKSEKAEAGKTASKRSQKLTYEEFKRQYEKAIGEIHAGRDTYGRGTTTLRAKHPNFAARYHREAEGKQPATGKRSRRSSEEVRAERVAKLEKQIADHEARLAALRAKHAELTGKESAESSTKATKSRSAAHTKPIADNEHARIDSQLGLLRRGDNPHEVWHAFGGTRESVYRVLRLEPFGGLENLYRGMGVSVPKRGRGETDGETRDKWAHDLAKRLEAQNKPSGLAELEAEIEAETVRLSELRAELENA